MSDLLDELARSLARPMPRSRALRLMGAALVSAAVPPTIGRGAVRPRRAAATCDPCTKVRCSCNGMFYDNGSDCTSACHTSLGCFTAICDPVPTDDFHCGSTCCKAGQKCVNDACSDGCPDKTEPCGRCGCYDPESQCCSGGSATSKHKIDDLKDCPNRKPKKDYEPKVNGCGPENGLLSRFIPDSYVAAQFKPACDEHDRCYGTCNSNRNVCDRKLQRGIQKACDQAYPDHDDFFDHRGVCYSRMNKYFAAVDKLGQGPWEAAQKEACDCC